MFVAIGVFFFRRFAQTGGMADDRFIHVLPERARMDEHLVIKTGRQEPRQVFVDRAYVELKAGPMVLARGLQTVEQFGRGGALVGFKLPATAKVHQRVGLFGACRHNATGAVIFERPTDKHLVIGQQCRGQRVAFVSAQLFAVERKIDSVGFVEQAAACGNSGAHEFKPWCLRQASEPPAGVFLAK